MGVWNPDVFLHKNNTSDGGCTEWSQVSMFDNDWEDTQYFWVQRFGTYYSIPWNNACAIRLLITKCNALQAQIDAGGAIDMDAILNAMLKSSFDNLQQFIGIVDAYRVALWNAPFNADFYAALARGFQQWP